MTTEDLAMPVTLEKARLNVWNLGGFVITAVVTAFAWGTNYSTTINGLENVRQENADLKQQISFESNLRKEDGAQKDAKLYAIEQKIPEIQRLDDKITRLTELIAQQAKANEEVNKRLDRVIEAQNGKLDTIITRQSEQSADIKVIQSQLSSNPRIPQRTRFPYVLNPTIRIK